MKGRKPKPLAQRDIENRTARAKRKTSIVPSALIRGNARALAAWKTLARDLRQDGLLTGYDKKSLELYCLEWASYSEAIQMIKKYGPTSVGSQGQPVVSAWVRIRNQAAQNLIRLDERFGFSPMSRNRLGNLIPDSEGPVEDEDFEF